jgi:hypothetical protein
MYALAKLTPFMGTTQYYCVRKNTSLIEQSDGAGERRPVRLLGGRFREEQWQVLFREQSRILKSPVEISLSADQSCFTDYHGTLIEDFVISMSLTFEASTLNGSNNIRYMMWPSFDGKYMRTRHSFWSFRHAASADWSTTKLQLRKSALPIQRRFGFARVLMSSLLFPSWVWVSITIHQSSYGSIE